MLNLCLTVYDNPKLDRVYMNVYIKFGENLSFFLFQDIEQKRNFAVNQGP